VSGSEAQHRFDGALDLRRLRAIGCAFGDCTLHATATEAVRASRTPEGPATLHVAITEPGVVALRAFGDGAGWALAQARDLLGLDDAAPDSLPTGARAVRLARTHRALELLVPIVLEQLVSGAEAGRAFANLVRHFSEPAPGPFADLWLPLGAEQLLAIPAAAFPALGALPRQGATLHELARRASRVEEAASMDAEAAERRLRFFPGVGVWTARSAMLRGLGHADAVPLGDYHLPRSVAFHLTGEAEGDDARMLELLEPWRGQRGRVVAWIQSAGHLPPRRGPRLAMRDVDRRGSALLRELR
jgi:3-methyladenine DNA glycosylase/8-oxoguanine DNA glycosylase